MRGELEETKESTRVRAHHRVLGEDSLVLSDSDVGLWKGKGRVSVVIRVFRNFAKNLRSFVFEKGSFSLPLTNRRSSYP